MKSLINALCYTHHEIKGHTHVTWSNGKPVRRVRKTQPAFARRAHRIDPPVVTTKAVA